MLEISKVVVTLLRDFDFWLVDPKQNWRIKAQSIALPYGWPCYVKRRNQP